jgi:hypothetical protein
MERMFQKSVGDTIKLINEQLVQVDRKRLKISTIFLSGGFSQSEYLFRKIQDLTRQWRFNLLRGDDSWTAVAKGGALMGLGVGCNVPPACVKCPYHIGVVASKNFTVYDHEKSQMYTDTFDNTRRAKDHINWIISKGDLVPQKEGISKAIKVIHKLSRNGSKTGAVTLIFSQADGLGNPPSQLQESKETQDGMCF